MVLACKWQRLAILFRGANMMRRFGFILVVVLCANQLTHIPTYTHRTPSIKLQLL